jgi:hypothetical protein
MIMGKKKSVILTTQQERDRAGRRHAVKRRLRAVAFSSLSLGFAVTVAGFIAARIVA